MNTLNWTILFVLVQEPFQNSGRPESSIETPNYFCLCQCFFFVVFFDIICDGGYSKFGKVSLPLFPLHPQPAGGGWG